ncbi:MAG: RluA family pseudouridine synthase [Endomicrobium sp.]|jgi:23S rRNA pseudouridine1911/1915/1917 synthase|nr:RluA family pseudouridine synthase [Endomicrobium sp.]
MLEKVIYDKFERERVDSYLASLYKEYSRSYFQRLADKQMLFVNNKPVLPSCKLKKGCIISFSFNAEEKLKIEPEEMNLNIIYEDSDIIIVNKQPGIVVHPSYGHSSGTLLNALAAYSKGKYTPYLVHRLDKDTSGLIIFAKNEKSKISLSKQFQKRTVKKIYLAAVKGIIAENSAVIDAPLGRSPQNRKLISVNSLAKKNGISKFRVLVRREEYSLVEVRIITGRTHQIRAHMKYIGHPVIGDKEYGGSGIAVNGKIYDRQILHAYNVIFTHPGTSRTVEFKADLPDDIAEIFRGIKI